MSIYGTLSPYMSRWEYSPEEEIVLNYFFTNTDKNVYCAKSTMSSQLWAFLTGQYSRTHRALRDRFLQLFEDQKKALEQWNISPEEYISLEELAQAIKDQEWLKIDFFEKKASDFLKKWGVKYGHNSLKDSDHIRYAIEGISEVLTKVIESPFPTLGSFQEKSTRYIAFSKESLIFPEEVEKSPLKDEIKALDNELIETYQKYLPIIKKVLKQNKIIDKDNFPSENAFEKTIDAKAFDIARYLLPSNVTTSLGTEMSTRTRESHISYMLSYHLSEAREVWKTLLKEWLKISPGLLSHVEENKYQQESYQDIQSYLHKNFERNPQSVRKGIANKERVKLISHGDLDTNILASILFESSQTYGASYQECLKQVSQMTESEKKELMHIALSKRGVYDRMPRSIQHTTIQFEFLLDFGAYRDIQRHRATKQLRQWPTAIHGYDYPEYIDLPGMENFKADYDTIMTKISEFANTHINEEPLALQYSIALGHLVRTSYEMDPWQLAYTLELRTTPQSHQSYRRLMQEVYRIVKTKAPLFAQYIRVDESLEANRAKEELKK